MVFFHLILTDDCNLCCSYCRGKIFSEEVKWSGRDVLIDDQLPPDLSIEPGDLSAFLRQDPDACVTFYGGEPLLRCDLIKEIMDHAPLCRFMLQTNGLLLKELPPRYIRRFETILVSLDGSPEITDRHRGHGTHRNIMENIRHLECAGFRGELIARMTVGEDVEIEDAVQYLSMNQEHQFSSIHWQLDAEFSGDAGIRHFRRWLDESYNPGIRRLIDAWVEKMAMGEGVARWYPFLQPVQDLLTGRESRLRCGAGHSNYTIMTDGHIGPCPAMIGMKEFYTGHISSAHPLHLPVVEVESECNKCSIRGFCGGRCLYSQIIRPWPEEMRIAVCDSVKNLQAGLLDALPAIRECIESRLIREEDLFHTRYNGCEIIP
ncbi:MAG: TIGR04084 family radical SAM/SPASM domain-containing protein [Methanolinea sp.]|jgi:putative peptide-modifying radical SAM enzyme|nr:TIGR04084 family radical SAM/SPASM domain-containing protein [Methanolinea sp.]